MKNLTFYLIVIIIILAGIGYTYYSLNKKHKQDAERWHENYSESSKEIKQINLTLKEFKKTMDNNTDSILKIARIKPKNVRQITNYNTYYTDTTVNFVFPKYEPKTENYPFADKAGCFEFYGSIFMEDTLPKLSVDKRVFKSDFTDVEYIRKDTINFLGLNLVKWWQKPEITYTIIDNCTGEKRVKKINVK
jgi:hypothetical protein